LTVPLAGAQRHFELLPGGQRQRRGERQFFQLQRFALGQLPQAVLQRQAGIGQSEQNPLLVELVIAQIGFVIVIDRGGPRICSRRWRLEHPLRRAVARAGLNLFKFTGGGRNADFLPLYFPVQSPDLVIHCSLHA